MRAKRTRRKRWREKITAARDISIRELLSIRGGNERKGDEDDESCHFHLKTFSRARFSARKKSSYFLYRAAPIARRTRKNDAFVVLILLISSRYFVTNVAGKRQETESSFLRLFPVPFRVALTNLKNVLSSGFAAGNSGFFFADERRRRCFSFWLITTPWCLN